MGVESKHGFWAWCGLVAYVALADIYLIRKGKPSMSQVFGETLHHPVKRFPLIGAWIVLTLHLYGELLEPDFRDKLRLCDPIGLLAKFVEKI